MADVLSFGKFRICMNSVNHSRRALYVFVHINLGISVHFFVQPRGHNFHDILMKFRLLTCFPPITNSIESILDHITFMSSFLYLFEKRCRVCNGKVLLAITF